MPVDRLMTNAAIWLGFVPAGESPEHAAETLKSAVRKADVAVFVHYLRCLAVDPRLVKYFEPSKAHPPGDPQTMIERLADLFKEADSAARKAGKKPPARPQPRGTDGHGHAAAAKPRPRDGHRVPQRTRSGSRVQPPVRVALDFDGWHWRLVRQCLDALKKKPLADEPPVPPH